MCNCNNCSNNLGNEEERQRAIKSCLERNPNAFRPKIGKGRETGDDIRRHNKGCNCKRSGCLKNYCECYEVGKNRSTFFFLISNEIRFKSNFNYNILSSIIFISFDIRNYLY